MTEGQPSLGTTFAHGVASFDPTTTGVLLWTRVVGVPRLQWHVATELDKTPTASGTVRPSLEDDWCVTVAVENLRPDTAYLFWFEAPDQTLSPVARTRTLPDRGEREFRIGVVCCSDKSMGWFNGYREMAETELDLVLHVGDAIYETPKGESRGGDPPGPAVTLDDYRERHAVTRADPDLQALHLRHPMVFVWDDHDVADNAWRHGAKEHDPDEHGPFETRLHAAARARHEWIPSRLGEPDDLLDMHRSFAVGDLMEIVVLDTRIPGRDEHVDHEGAPALDDPARSLIGDGQRRWVERRLAENQRPWTLLVTAVTLSPLKLPIADDDVPTLDAALPSGYAIVDGEALCTDEWDGYPAERDHLLAKLRERTGGTVVISGDIHSSWALEVDDDHGTVAAEFVCPSLTSTPMGHQLPRGTRGLADEAAEEMPHRRWAELRSNGWLHLTIDTRRVRADWFAVACDDPAPVGSAGGELLASWEARLGPPVTLQPCADALPSWPDRQLVPPTWLPPRPTAPEKPRARRWLVVIGATALAMVVALLVRRNRKRH